MAKVNFSNADVSFKLKEKRKIAAFIQSIFKSEGRTLQSMQYIFCSDDFLLNINNQFLKHDYYTDIITFDLTNEGNKDVVGEVYISVDRVRENALIQNTTWIKEMARVVFHGALHLCGYKDKKKSEITLMRQKEDYYLKMFNEF